MNKFPNVDEASGIGPMGAGESRYCASTRMDWVVAKPGVHAKLLYEDESRGERTMLVRLDPQAKSLPHSHTEHEQIFVIEGSFDDGARMLEAGDFCVRTPGQVHTAFSPDGALVMVTYIAV